MRAIANAPRHSGYRLTSNCGAAVCMALALAAASPLVLAADNHSAVRTQHNLSVPAGSLATALSSFAQQTGINLSFSPAQVQGINSQGVRNAQSVDAALNALLSGTGLAAQKSSSGYVLVAAPTDADTYQLSPLTIEADQMRQSGVAPVPGYFADNSRTASKTDTPLLETAQSISVVTAEQIADRKAVSVEEAVAYSAGVSVGGAGLDPRFDQINIRGYATATNADYLDGMRQANSGWLSYFTTDPFALERIEILKGPASVLYGQISPGGMVNRVSKRPSEDAVQQIELQYGSNDHVQGQFDLGGRLDDDGDVLYRLVAIARDADTDIEQVPNNVGLIAPSLTWRINEQTDLTVLAQYQDRETAGSPRPYQAGATLTNFWPGDEDFDKLDQQQTLLGYEFEHRFNDTFTVQNNLRYGHTNTTNQYTSPSLQPGTSVLNRTATGLYEEMDAVTTDTRLISSFETGALRHTLLSGLDYAYTDFDVEYSSGAAPSIDINNPDHNQPIARPRNVLVEQSGVTHRSGAYLQDQIEWGNWRLSAGLRQDWVNTETTNELNSLKSKTHDDQTTGQIGALYLFESGLAPYLSYAQSFLPQTGNDRNGDAFEPTEGEQLELGIKYQPPGSSTMLTASVYQLVQSNTLTKLPSEVFSEQKGEQTSRGLELEAVSDLTEDLSMTASYAFNDAEITESKDGNKGNTPSLMPKHLATLWLDYTLASGPLQGLGVSGGARYSGSNYSNRSNTDKNEAYTQVDLGAHYDLRGSADGIRLGVNAKNLTDKRYIVCEDGYCYRGAGRAVIGSVSYRW